MFHSALARAVELHHAMLEAITQLENYQPSDTPYAEVTPKAGIGYGCTEAPRGILWHRYELDGQGRVVNAVITPPTSQNQARIEEDLKLSLEAYGLNRSDEELKLHGEKVIRNYDPCISCSTHFLKLKVARE
jgi:coenzyme F420-reducing hydrogenase alpha subunit